MKKLFLICMIVLAVAAPVFADGHKAKEGDIAVGLALGEPSGITATYELGDDLSAKALVAFSFGSSKLNIKPGIEYAFSKFSIDKIDLYPYAGADLAVGLIGDFSLGAHIAGGVTYYLEDPELEIFLELAPGFNLLPSAKFDFDGAIGVRLPLDL